MIDQALSIIEPVEIVSLLGMILVGLSYLALPCLWVFGRRPGSSMSEGNCDAGRTPTDQLPDVLIQMPVFNEPAVVAQLLDAVAAIDWPREKLHIQLLDDSIDHTAEIAQKKIAELIARGFRIDHVCRSHRSGYKAAALAEGLTQSTAPFVAVLDADFRPPPDWLRSVMPRLMADPRAGFVQSRCEFSNANLNWFTRTQALLFDAHFVMEQAVRERAGLVIQFNGTAAVWRRSAIEDAGGWSADSLSEDLDLTIRAALAGWHGVFAMDPAVPGLVPHRIEHWRVQQGRWVQGFVQTARKLISAIWTTNWPLMRKVSAGFLLLYQLIFPITVVAVTAGLLDLALRGGQLLFLPSVLAAVVVSMIPLVALSMTLPPYLALRRGNLAQYACALVMVPPLIVYLAFANIEPMLAAIFGRSGPFHRTPKGEPEAPLEERSVSA